MKTPKRGPRAAPTDARDTPPAVESAPGFPVVGVGASAGGLEAFSELLRRIPADAGMAFVLIQHLDPTHESLLSEALRRATTMPVEEIQDGARVERDHVYVIPPNADVAILGGALTVRTRAPDARRPFLPIDYFLKALAADCRDRAIGVVLTGMGSDGAAGLRAIKEANGITLAEDPTSAKFDGMPAAAVAAGVVDFVLPIPQLAEELLRVARHPYVQAARDEGLAGDDEADLRQILLLVRGALGADFSEYKPASVRRRIARRMALRAQPTMHDYVALLERDRPEIDALFDDILIHVTSFFRDGGALDRLADTAFPAILDAKRAGAPIRIWVAGCSTGEEVYSIAICLLELLAKREGAVRRPIQIFGTDVSDRAIAVARAGVYPDSIAQDVGAERLARFFEKLDGGKVRIAKHVRETCAFVRHDLTSDPPFSRLDLVSCRNVLIYFDAKLQQRVLAAFHFALGVPGFLLLGRNEAILDGHELFTVADRDEKLFARTSTRSVMHLAPTRDLMPALPRGFVAATPAPAAIDLVRRTDALLLEAYAPPGVLITERGEILQFRGRTAPFLEPAAGQPQHNVFKMVAAGLLAELRVGLARAKESGATFRSEGLEVRADGAPRRFNLVVIPVAITPGGKEGQFAVLFEPAPKAKASERAAGLRSAAPATPGEEARVAQLTTELRAAKEYLQTVIAEHEQTNDDLHASNEELVSSNEELQSLNEELGTAKEELQATNEELITLNEELHSRNAELNAVSSDIINILASVEVPILMVDGARRIRRFTPKAKALLNLLPQDVGRPIGDIQPNLVVESLDALIAGVIEGLELHQSEVQDRDGRWYRLQIRPYATVDKRIDGAVLAIVDIDVLKRSLAGAELARDFATRTLEAIQTPLVLLDRELRVLSANDAYFEVFRVPLGATEQRSLFEVLHGAWDDPRLRKALAATTASGEHFQRLELARDLPSVGPRTVSLSARAVRSPSGDPMILVAIEDVTDRRAAEQERARLLLDAEGARAAAESANRAKDLFLATLSHELRTPLTSLLLQAQLLGRGGMDDARRARAAQVIARATRAQAQLIDDLLDVSRIVTGKLTLTPEAVDLAAVARAVVELIEPSLEKKSLRLVVVLAEGLPPVWADPLRLRQALWNLLVNAVKFTPARGEIRLTLDAREGLARLRVADSGSGIEAAFLPRIFDRFSQEEQARSGGHGGLGLGLAIARHVVEASGGALVAESAGVGLGATFTVTMKLMDRELAPPPRPAPAAPSPGGIRAVRVLLVDDDPWTREAIGEALEAESAEVRAASSVLEAMSLFAEQAPDVVVCDLAMPGEDGYGLIARIRALAPEHGGRVPALALTGLATEEDRRHAIAAGFQLHLAKPVDIDRLVAAIGELSRWGRGSAAEP